MWANFRKELVRAARIRLTLEHLEERQLMAADLAANTLTRIPFPPSTTTTPAAVRTYDGTGNNLLNSQWGSTDEDLLRVAAAEYTDGISSLAGADRPSARVISNALAAEDPNTAFNDR